jgi:type IV secretion system protein VirD4
MAVRREGVESPRPQGSESAVDSLLWLAVGAAFGATVLVWVVGQVAAVLFGVHHWLPVSLAEVAKVPFHLAAHPGDPRLAWPKGVRGMLPGPVGMYAALVLVLIIPIGLASAVLGRRFRWDRRLQQRGAQWAGRWRLRRLIVLAPRPGRITLGRRGGWWGRLLLAVESCHSVLCFGPAGSFKTAGLVIPAVLEWSGPVITTSIKPDVLRATLRRRVVLGEVWVYDPLGLSGVPGAQWTPLAHCGTYTAARKVARTLAEAADVSGLREQDANYWTLLGAKLLGVLLFAAARSDRTMTDVARWVDIQETDEVTEALEFAADAMALDAWSACRARPDNTLGSVYGTAETLLDVFADPIIAASADGCDLDVDALLSGANTLYLYAPANEQTRLRPLFELLISTIITRAEELAARQANGMLDPRLLVCLDEAGNCAALAKLPELATTARGQGIQLVTIWHDLGQLQHRYGRRATTVLNGHRAKLFLSGQADIDSLELASKLIGDQAVTHTSHTAAADGRASTTASVSYRRLAPMEVLRQLRPREGVLLYGHLPPARVRLRAWFRNPRLRRLALRAAPARPPVPQHAHTGHPILDLEPVPVPASEADTREVA